MTNNLRGQRLPSSSQQSRKNSAWGVIVGIALLGVFLSASVQAAKFKANSLADPPARDSKPGDLFSAPFYNHRLSLPHRQWGLSHDHRRQQESPP
jgi:hypothetical protein